METEVCSGEINQIQELSNLLSEMIRQFIKTKEELMRTTLQVQIELLTNRLRRLKVSISEIQGQIDNSCLPLEVKLVESEIGIEIRPYEITKEGKEDIQAFSWKSKKTLEKEKMELLSNVDEPLKNTISRIYDIYAERADLLCEIEEKSRMK